MNNKKSALFGDLISGLSITMIVIPQGLSFAMIVVISLPTYFILP